MNRRALADDLGYPNRQALDVRLNRLIHTCAGIWCHQIDDVGRRVEGAQSKLYLCDPVLAWLGSRLRTGLHTPDFSRLTEATLAVTLARVVDESEPGRWESDDTIGYIRTGSGNEIDLAPVAVPTDAGVRRTAPIESKWVAFGWRAEAKVIEGRFKGGIVATRAVVDRSHPAWAVPAPLLALLLQ